MKKKNRRMHGNVRQSDFEKIAQLCRRHISRDWETSQQAKTSRSRKGGSVRFGASGLPEALLASLCFYKNLVSKTVRHSSIIIKI